MVSEEVALTFTERERERGVKGLSQKEEKEEEKGGWRGRRTCERRRSGPAEATKERSHPQAPPQGSVPPAHSVTGSNTAW